MASYLELAGLLSRSEESELRKRVMIAGLVKSNAVEQEVVIDPLTDAEGSALQVSRQNYARRLLTGVFAEKALFNLADEAELILHRDFEAVYRFVIIANAGNSVAQITGATDAQIQSAVDDAFEFLAA